MYKDPAKRNEYYKKYRQAHRARLTLNSRKYEHANKNRITDRKLKAKYGLTLEQFNEMSLIQQNRCLLCSEIKRLSVDHCHITNKVRGLLCTECNLALGLFKDNSEVLRKASNYLSR